MRVLVLAMLAALAIAVSGCGEEKTVKVGNGPDGVVKRDIDQAKTVAAKQSNFQREGEDALSH